MGRQTTCASMQSDNARGKCSDLDVRAMAISFYVLEDLHCIYVIPQSHTAEDLLETDVRLVDHRKSSIVCMKLATVANNSSQSFLVSLLFYLSLLVANQLMVHTIYSLDNFLTVLLIILSLA